MFAKVKSGLKLGENLYDSVTDKFSEIVRQIHDPNGYPFDPEALKRHLQVAIEGRFNGEGPKKLLEPVMGVRIAALKNFVAADHFKVDTNGLAVRIGFIGDGFRANFLGVSESAYERKSYLNVSKLLKSSCDIPILTELAGKTTIRLGQFFSLLSEQGRGQDGALLVNGYPSNIAYIRDVNRKLWAVEASWFSSRGGWLINALPIEIAGGHCGGSYVLSHSH